MTEPDTKSREEIATQQQAEDEQRIATDNQQEAALQKYIDNMSELLLKEDLRKSHSGDEVQNIARVRTLTVLQRLDAYRKRSVLLFLHESRLINRDKPSIVLRGASFSEAELSGAHIFTIKPAQSNMVGIKGASHIRANFIGVDLSFANLRGTRLCEANLGAAILIRADLRGADLEGAIFKDAFLRGADLKYTQNITIEELEKQAKYLTDSIMPDGSKYP